MSTTQMKKYNEGGLSSKYALIDLSNTQKFTNFMYSIPHRRKITITDRTLTIHEGSTLTIPNGYSADGNNLPRLVRTTLASPLKITLPKAVNTKSQFTENPTKYTYLVYNSTSQALELQNYSVYTYNKNANANTGASGNTFTRLVGTVPQICSYPLGVFDENYVFVEFGAIAFYNYYIFVDSSVEFDVACGRDYSGRPKNNHIVIDDPVVTEIQNRTGNTFSGGRLLLDEKGNATPVAKLEIVPNLTGINITDHVYAVDENYVYDKNKNPLSRVIAGRISLLEGRVSNIYSFNFPSTYLYRTVEDDLIFRGEVEDALIEMNNSFNAFRTEYLSNKPVLLPNGYYETKGQ